MAVMPAAAPATSNVFRSAALRWKHWANSDPMAPPVMMIGPSAPNGPPLPIEIAADIGLSTATLSDSRLSPNRIVSIASGIPCPRIFSEPNRAMTPMIRLPMTGIVTIARPTAESEISAASAEIRPNQNAFVAIAIDLSRSHAPRAPPVPTIGAIRDRRIILRSTLWSAS